MSRAAAVAVQLIPLAKIRESAHNPREHYDPVALQELGASLVAQGQITPVVVRPLSDDVYELAAGHRRFRAAQSVGLEALVCSVRRMTDEEFLEVMAVEQLQHEDFTPLEEAASYRNLLSVYGDVARVAERVKKERRYVADRLRLLQLAPESRVLLARGLITVEHASLLATLSEDEQRRTIGEGLFTHDRGLFEEAGHMVDVSDDPLAGLKPVSVPELRQWINTNIRLALDAGVTADLFPETVRAVQEAEEQRRKHVFVTHLRHIPDGAKDGPRILKAGVWKDAGLKPCEHLILGTVLIGPQRGASLQVCVAKKVCLVHWRDEIRSAERAAAGNQQGGAAATDDRMAKAQAKREAEEAKRKAERERWVLHAPAVVDAIGAKLGKLKITAASGALKELIEDVNWPEAFDAAVKKHAPLTPKSTPEQILRHLAFAMELRSLWNEYSIMNNLAPLAKRYGVDAKAIIAAAEKAAGTPAVPAKKPTAGAKAKRAKARP